MRKCKWMAAAAVAAMLVAGPAEPRAARAADDVTSFDLILGKTKLKLSEVLEGDGAGRKPKDKLKLVFDVPASIGDLQVGDRIALAFTAYDAEGIAGRTVTLGDRASQDPDDFIELVDAGKGRLKCAKGDSLRGFRTKLKYRPIRPAILGKDAQPPRPGRLIVELTQGLFTELPFVPLAALDPQRPFLLNGLAMLTDVLILRSALTLRLGCYRDDFALGVVLLVLQNEKLRILRAKMKRK